MYRTAKRLASEAEQWAKDLFRLFVPPCCPVCGRVLEEGERFLCTACRWEMPLTGWWKTQENPMQERLSDFFPVCRASAFFYYQKGSGYDRLIHRFKYEGKASLSRAFGEWFGEELRRSEYYADVDLIVPVPLHPYRFLKRGYNQAEIFAFGLGKKLKAKVCRGNLVRKTHNPTQTRRGEKERWENVDGIFAVRNPDRFRNRHLLLVDDVITTGATLVSCAETLLSRVENCRISAVTLAVSSRHVFGKG